MVTSGNRLRKIIRSSFLSLIHSYDNILTEASKDWLILERITEVANTGHAWISLRSCVNAISALLTIDENRSVKAGRVLQSHSAKTVMVDGLDCLKPHASALRYFTSPSHSVQGSLFFPTSQQERKKGNKTGLIGQSERLCCLFFILKMIPRLLVVPLSVSAPQ